MSVEKDHMCMFLLDEEAGYSRVCAFACFSVVREWTIGLTLCQLCFVGSKYLCNNMQKENAISWIMDPEELQHAFVYS